MRFRTDLLIEGVETVDGRTVERGAVSWAPAPTVHGWPILFRDDDHETSRRVGWIEDVRRCRLRDESVRVVADCRILGSPFEPDVRAMLADGTLRLAADLTIEGRDLATGAASVSGSRWDGGLTIERGARLLGATITLPPAPAWPDLRFDLVAA